MDKDELASEVMMLRMLLSAVIEVVNGDPVSRTRLTHIIGGEIDRQVNKEERRKTLAERMYLRKLRKLALHVSEPHAGEPDASG